MKTLKTSTFPLRRLSGPAVLTVAAIALGACAPKPASGINDPYEVQNRRTHNFNKALDQGVIRPVSKAYVAVVPDPILDRVSAFSDNLSAPAYVLNNLLQGNFEDAFVNSSRFVINTVLGFGGLVDVAAEAGVPERDTDWGETFFVWGLPEGAYVEMPVIGPATERDRAGRIVGVFTNPMSYVIPSPESYAGTGAKVLDRLGDRGRYASTVDGVLYDSADSYAQARSIYLQNRRYELGGGATASADPYDDPYGSTDANTDPYDE